MNEGIHRSPTHQAPTPAPVHNPAPEKRPTKSTWGKLTEKIKPIISTVVVIALIGLSYGYVHARHQLDNASQQSSQNATQQLIEKVGKLVVLPNNESPTTATVNDAAKLKRQQFFSKSQNGDKVLIYSKSGQAVLYRPSVNKVVEYTQISFNNSNTP